jgi:two-component system invasion response regulator UvrY
MLRVLIADDHAVVRRGIKDILRDIPVKSAVVEAADGQEALEKVLAEDWDVVILDVTMPRKTGVEALRAIRAARPNLPVIMLSMHSGEHYVNASLKAGANGYVSKDTASDELWFAIETVMGGGTYVHRCITAPGPAAPPPVEAGRAHAPNAWSGPMG